MPFLFFKFNTFCYNILNNKILSSLKNDIDFNGYLRHTYEVKVPCERTKFGLASLNVILTILIINIKIFND